MSASFWAPAIRDAREHARLSVAAVAHRTGASTDRLAAIERGEVEITVGELFAIARALRLDFEALLRGDVRRMPGAALAFRSHDAGWASLSEADLGVCERALHRARSLLEVNERLGRERSERAVFEPRDPLPDVEQEVRDLSRLVRERLGNAEGTLPDLYTVLGSLDVVIVEHRFASADVDAVAVMEAGIGNGAAIVVAERSHAWRVPLRRRVLLAHELCHVLFDPVRDDADAIVDFDGELSGDPDLVGERSSRYLPQDLPRERRARAFAAEFLMPTASLRTLLGPPRHVFEYGEARRMVDKVREHFETPLEIALNQLWNRRYLAPLPDLTTEDPRRDLLEYLRARSTEVTATPRVAGASADMLTARAREAWVQGQAADGDVRRWLGLSPFDPLPWTA